MAADLEFLIRSAPEVAPRLLGCILEREIDGVTVRVRIVETEAYDQTDAASHSYKGRTPRTDVMFGPAGHLYVYFTYGMHYCMNVVTGAAGDGAAVLIRAVEPLERVEVLSRYRHGASGANLTNGPAKLCQALMVDRSMNGHDLREPPLRLIVRDPLETGAITRTARVGITKAKDVAWRFYETGNAYVSHAR